MTIPKGSFTAIVGQVGSGKSSLLSALLGDLKKVSGTVNVNGDIAYVSQEAWIRNLTLEKNILFGKEMERKTYEDILEACALMPDLDILPGRDQTEIGEKGINLSGGQKQRVSIARAVYQDRDFYVMDDPLSAVDVHVGKHIFEKVIGNKGLLKDKTRVLVTHGITHLPKADQIIVMNNGTISEMGTYSDLLSHNGAFAELMRTYLNENGDESVDEEGESSHDEEAMKLKEELRRQISTLSEGDTATGTTSGNESSPSKKLRRRKKRSLGHDSVDEGQAKGQNSKKKEENEKPGGPGGGGPGGRGGGGRRLVQSEGSKTGGINFKVLFSYLVSMGKIGPSLYFLFYCLNMFANLYSNIWLSDWSSDTGVAGNVSVDPGVRVGVYGGVGGSIALCVFVQTVSLAYATSVACKLLHEKLLVAIVKAPMSFFDTTPSGRILNRFSGDMSVVDSNIRFTLNACFNGVSQILTMLIAICYSTPIFLSAVIPLTLGYVFIQRFYVKSSNQLKRISSVLTSPIYSHFGETLTGASSIRAFGKQKDFVQSSDKLLDKMQRGNYATICISRWLSIWLEFVGALVVLFAALFAVLSRDAITGGLVGLSITYALQVTDKLSMFVRNVCDLESNVVAVERIQEYSQTQSEAPWVIESQRPSRSWPSQGAIAFEDYSTRYRPGLDLILKNITCAFNPGEKIGVVGRTGAGKSSMTLGLFRIIEPANGTIFIDGTNVRVIGLHDLRSKLTIIPQDPVLFSGDLRTNLDPLLKHSDAEIWQALEHSYLKDFVKGLPKQLHHECQEGGQNLSVGQRQLVCLARALLRKTKILVLDEATAAVDMETDDLIQSTIRSAFKGCTVITIAHRINTVMDYDRIMVLEAGQIKELDSPGKLLENPQGLFYLMCKHAGLLGSDNKNGEKSPQA